MKKKISIICPVYNEEQTVPLFYRRLQQAIAALKKTYAFELVFTNNASTDGTLAEIQKLRKHDPNIEVLTFSRNFGYQSSILAGITHASGSAIIIIDVDCEDPPEMIPKFVKKWEEGYDIVYGIRGKRPEAYLVTAMRRWFYRILKFMADTDIILDMAEFSLISARVRDQIVKNSNTFPFLRAEIAFSGFSKFGIHYDREPRIIGKTHYNLYGMAVFAIAGILSISTFPLRFPLYSFPLLLLVNGALIAAGFWSGVNTYFSMALILDALFIAMVVSFQSIYIARIYKNGISRPVYIIDWDLSSLKKNNGPQRANT